MLRKIRIAIFAIGALAHPCAWAAEPPPLMLADVYHVGDAIDLSAYWVSEKFDGVRGYWDGRRLWTRGGSPVRAPGWFTHGWPSTPLDGELWAGRGRFALASATVRSSDDGNPAWRQMHYLVFDLPAESGPFDARLRKLRSMFAQVKAPTLKLVEQFHVGTSTELLRRRDAIVAQGGEGLVLHRGDADYRAERSDDLLKFKPLDDAEARVLGYRPGRGRLAGMVGALEVETPDGRRFRIGSGLSDAERRNPPAIGSTITYTYSGLTTHGLPRFARFLRVRDDEPAHPTDTTDRVDDHAGPTAAPMPR